MHLPEDPDSSAQINIVPMIDVIFVVLIFFMLSSLFLTRSEGLPVNLPNAATGEAQLKQHRLTITLSTTGELRLGNEITTLAALPEHIQSRRVGDRPILLVIQADESISHGKVVALMDRLRAIDNVQLGIATEPLAPQR